VTRFRTRTKETSVTLADINQKERHASWLELFFDLVAVAGIAQLSHLLHGSTSAALYAVCFLAFWTAWMCFTVYGNVAGDSARALPMLVAMSGLVVMAAAVGDVEGDRGQAFAIAYVAVRVVSGRVWRARGGIRVVVEWPVAQIGVGVLPWVASLWGPASWRPGLWSLGLVLDLLIAFAIPDGRIAARLDRRAVPDPGGRITRPARLDTAHFGERLGLFTIIVLGEGVMTVTDAMAEASTWTAALYSTAAGALVLLAGLWASALRLGFGGIPFLTPDAIRPRLILPLHCLTAGVLAVSATGIGDLVSSVQKEHVTTGTRWLLCGSIAAFGVIAVAAGRAAGRGRLWALGVLTPLLALLALVAGLGGALTTAETVWLLAAAVVAGLALTYLTDVWSDAER
jgi:low temperature requirement protein LtrA